MITECETKDSVIISRASYEALMAAAKNFLRIARNSKASRTNPNTTFVDTRDWEAALAACRAAGIVEEKT
jgi:hypothetical protein